MNYARCAELPLTSLWLEAKAGDRILDVGSPKLLAVELSSRKGVSVVATDFDEYFVGDIEHIASRLQLPLTAQAEDARSMTFEDASFDKTFSVSVIEHIPGNGDAEAIREMGRTLRPGGVCVVTVPAAAEPVEEWVAGKAPYWNVTRRDDGRYFYQRRYTLESFANLLDGSRLEIDRHVFIAEKPLGPSGVQENGMYLHNSGHIARRRMQSILRRRPIRRIPLSRYLFEKRFSDRCHFLTESTTDERARQLAVRLVKR